MLIMTMRPASSKVHICVVTVLSNDLSGLIKSRLSLESQIFNNWKHVIVDSGKDQETVTFLRTLPNANSKWISEPDFGIYNAMNKALSMITEDSYVFFLNAGDIFANEESLAIAAKVLGESGLPEWGCTTHEEIAENGEGWVCKLVSKPSVPNQLYATGYRSHQGVIMKNSFIKSLGGFDETYQVAADWDLIVKAISTESPITWNSPLARFETGGFSSKKISLAHEELFQLRKIYLLKKPSDYIYDYLWRSLFLYPIGYRSLVGCFLGPIFYKNRRRRQSWLVYLYKKFIVKEHSKSVRKLPSQARRMLLKCISYLFLYHRVFRPNLFHLMRRNLAKRLNLEKIEAA